MTGTYIPKKPGSSRFVQLDALKIHYNEWGEKDWPAMVMLHGWMDVGASFQFVVDALEGQWRVIAPDWRGFGLSDWPVSSMGWGRSYWFPDYLADLELLLDALLPDQPVRLIGHSMGANLAMLYAGIRPQRVQSVVNLEGFGLPDMPPSKAPSRYRQWLDEQTKPPTMRPYESREAVAQRLQKTNYRLAQDKALFLAQHWSRPNDEGYQILGDPAHRIAGPFLYRLNEAQAVWAEIAAPVLHVEARQTEAALWMSKAGEAVDFDQLRERFSVVPDWAFAMVEDAGHMVHHDQPEVLARLIEQHVGKKNRPV